MYFEYGEKEISYLKKKDKKLAQVIDKLGFIKIEINENIFEMIIFKIIGQQISMKAQKTIWNRLKEKVIDINPTNIHLMDINELKSIGISTRKADYIKNFACKVYSGEFKIDELKNMTDEEVIQSLSTLKGIGIWTAEMIMIFSLKRQNIISYNDLAILRGMRMLYRHTKIDKNRFEKYKKRYHPYATVASLYLWEISSGVIPELKDPKEKIK